MTGPNGPGRLPPVLTHESLASSAADWIAAQILDGAIGPGERVTETALAEEMGISRSPVREALQTLARDGLIDLRPRKGAFVAQLSRAVAAEVYDCRLLLEPECIRLCVERIEDERIAALVERFGEMTAAVRARNGGGYVERYQEYSWLLLDGCQNRAMLGFAENARRQSMRYWGLTVRTSEQYLRRGLRRQRALHAAVTARDPDTAARVSRTNIELFRDELLTMLARLPGMT